MRVRWLMIGILILASGCAELTKEQLNTISENNARIARIGVNIARLSASVNRLEPIAGELFDKIKDVVEKVAKGELPKEEGERLIALYKKQKGPVEAEIKMAKAEMELAVIEAEALAKETKAVSDSGVKWYQQLWLMLPGIITTVIAIAKGRSTVVGLKKTTGVLVRAGDRTPGFGAAVHTEAAFTEGVDRTMTDALWKELKAG